MQDFIQKLHTILPEERIKIQALMKEHTTFRVGGPADVMVSPKSSEELTRILSLAKEYQIPYYVIGHGSNLLVGDGGIRGLVIEFGKEYAEITWDGDRGLIVQAGCMMSTAANFAYKHGLTGMEFAAGIPGTLGGAIRMNAGAYGGEMKDIVKTVTVMLPDGDVKVLDRDEMHFAYRHSIADEQDLIILETVLVLEHGDSDAIQSRMQELSQARREKQPLEYPSAGSTFKRPEGYFAGKLIMEAGLAGYRIGDAQVSEKHCGFVINRGEATAKEIDTLMKDVIRNVQEKDGVTLEPEVRRVGEFV
ncbi:MAG: UDP-N-acetylmuramate dehydrogenase [Lachnospiraceae bacterium]|nr:UDP-N-acetylmuramate dehydrogenase [Lachnospiraceae bacterium]